jgi:sugar lactone lactonase YvrE
LPLRDFGERLGAAAFERMRRTTVAGERQPVGIIRWPEQAVNFAFGGPDLRTVLCCAHTSVYALRVKVPGNPHPWYKLRGH